MFNGGSEILQPSVSNTVESNSRLRQAYVQIVEEPAQKALRFRYECEGRSAGSIPGASSSSDNKTYPTIRVVGYHGRAVVVVSCVTKEEPYRPHPHNLVGRDGCKRGVCTLEIPIDTMTINFCNLGIQCVKKKDIESALRAREEIRVDPFRTGFNHRNQPTSIDLNSVRLCFQVFLEGDKKGKFTFPLQPKVSQPIFDKKAMSDLVIVKLSHCTYPVYDGDKKEVILLCEKVAKEDIKIRFFEENDGIVIWEEIVDVQPSQVHKQAAISFKPPSYRNLDITEPVKVCIQLKRPSDGVVSEPLPFEFIPSRGRKKPKYDSVHSLGQDFSPGNDPMFMNIKVEPKETLYHWPLAEMMQTDPIPYRGPTQGELPSTSRGLPPMPCTTSDRPLPSLPVNWNLLDMGVLPNQQMNATDMNSQTPHYFTNMDSQQPEMAQINLNSEEIALFEGVGDITNLSESLNNNMSVTDNNENNENNDVNTTDSFTKYLQSRNTFR